MEIFLVATVLDGGGKIWITNTGNVGMIIYREQRPFQKKIV